MRHQGEGSLVIGFFAVGLLLGLLFLLVLLVFLVLLFLLVLLGLLLVVLLGLLDWGLFLLLGLFLGVGSLGLSGLDGGELLLDSELVSDSLDGSGLVGLSEEKLPCLGGSVVDSAELVELAGGLEGLLLLGEGSELPLALIDVAFHDDTLCLGDDTVIAGGNGRGGHLSDGNSDGLTLGGDEHDLLADLDAGLVAEHSGEHELGTVADSVNRGVLHDDSLVLNEQDLKGHDDAAEISLAAVLLEVPLGVLDVVHGDHGVVLLEGTGSHSAELLHVSAASEDVADMHAKGSHVGTSFAAEPEDTHIALHIVIEELALIDGSHTELLLDGGNQRGSLEDGAGKLEEGLFNLLDLLNVLMELDDSDVLFTCGLLGLDEAGSVVDAGDEATGDLGVEGAGVTGLVDLENALDPCNDLVGGGVGWLVKVDDTVALELEERSSSG